MRIVFIVCISDWKGLQDTSQALGLRTSPVSEESQVEASAWSRHSRFHCLVIELFNDGLSILRLSVDI